MDHADTKIQTQDRLFLGIPIPDKAAESLTAGLAQYPQHIERAIDRDKWHLTLFYLGEPANPRQYYSRLARPLKPPSFVPTVRLNHLGRGLQRDQLWAYAEDSNVLNELRKQLRDRIRTLRLPNYQAEIRHQEFKPHVTVAKLFKQTAGVGMADHPIQVSFTVPTILLYRSERTPQGSRYHTEGELSLS